MLSVRARLLGTYIVLVAFGLRLLPQWSIALCGVLLIADHCFSSVLEHYRRWLVRFLDPDARFRDALRLRQKMRREEKERRRELRRSGKAAKLRRRLRRLGEGCE